MIKIEKAWLKPLALALSLPSMVITLAYIANLFVEKKILSKGIAFTIFLAIIINTLLLMVFYANKKKNKHK